MANKQEIQLMAELTEEGHIQAEPKLKGSKMPIKASDDEIQLIAQFTPENFILDL